MGTNGLTTDNLEDIFNGQRIGGEDLGTFSNDITKYVRKINTPNSGEPVWIFINDTKLVEPNINPMNFNRICASEMIP